jgi:hypothetical protein
MDDCTGTELMAKAIYPDRMAQFETITEQAATGVDGP